VRDAECRALLRAVFDRQGGRDAEGTLP